VKVAAAKALQIVGRKKGREDIMKRIILIAAVLTLVWGGAGWAASMSNSKHDLSSGSTASVKTSGATTTTEVCIFCHTPHKASPGGGRPLWNHTLTSSTLSWSPNKTVRGTDLPTDLSTAALEGPAACLSCHDGSVALGSVLVYYSGGSSSATTFSFAALTDRITAGGAMHVNGPAYIDVTTMSKNHPLGVQKPDAKTGFTDFVAADGGTGVWYRTSSQDSNDYVACQSCHNPHLTTNQPFLRISNSGSAICKSCHDL
jgi:predicted CXXCH cytochrome family protein